MARGAKCTSRGPGAARDVICRGRHDALLEGARRAKLAGADLIRGGFSSQVAGYSYFGKVTATVAFLSLWILALSLREFGFEIQNSQTTKGWGWKWVLLSNL